VGASDVSELRLHIAIHLFSALTEVPPDVIPIYF